MRPIGLGRIEGDTNKEMLCKGVGPTVHPLGAHSLEPPDL